MATRPDQRGLPGSWRGAPPVYGGTGSGAGPRGITAPGTGPRTGGWSPTVLNLLVLVALEVGGYVALRWVFRKAHGG